MASVLKKDDSTLIAMLDVGASIKEIAAYRGCSISRAAELVRKIKRERELTEDFSKLGQSELLDLPMCRNSLKFLGLKPSIMQYAGVKTYKELIAMPDNALMQIPYLGRVHINKLRERFSY